jgi:hypothetical protein
MRRTSMAIQKEVDRETEALKRVIRAGVKAPESAIKDWIRSVGADLILRSSHREIRAVAAAF